MLTTLRKILLVYHYLVGNAFYKLARWGKSSGHYDFVAARLRGNASSIASAQLFSRQVICYVRIGDTVSAKVACARLTHVIDSVGIASEGDRAWVHDYAQSLCRCAGIKLPAVSGANAVNYDLVSDAVKRRFPQDDLRALQELPILSVSP